MSDYILWLHEVEMSDVDRVGGKNASLGEMLRNLTADGGVFSAGGQRFTQRGICGRWPHGQHGDRALVALF